MIFAPVEKPTATPTAALTGDVAENASGANSADNSEAMATPPGNTTTKDSDNVDVSGSDGKGNGDTEGEQAEQQAVGKRGAGVAEGEGKGGVPSESENSAVARSEYRDDFGCGDGGCVEGVGGWLNACLVRILLVWGGLLGRVMEICRISSVSGLC